MRYTNVPSTLSKRVAPTLLVVVASISGSIATAQTTTDKTLAPNTRFFVPPPAPGSVQQAASLLEHFQLRNSLLIATTEATPQAVWLASGTPSATAASVTKNPGGSQPAARCSRLRALQHPWPGLRQLFRWWR